MARLVGDPAAAPAEVVPGRFGKTCSDRPLPLLPRAVRLAPPAAGRVGSVAEVMGGLYSRPGWQGVYQPGQNADLGMSATARKGVGRA